MNSTATMSSKSCNEPAVEGPREGVSNITMDQTYRVHFSCENMGRYIRTSKRRIRWVFGFRRQPSNVDEEHDIELIWSVNSGKTRIFWNQCKISSLVREGGNTDVVEFTWQTMSNDVLKVIAHSSSSGGVARQYDLCVNGFRFSQLLTLSELVRKRAKETTMSSAIQPKRSDASLNFPKEISVPPSSSSFQLAMVGYQTDSADGDELQSELYSSALNEVRLSVTSFLPQTEETISRAIMDVFMREDDTGHHSPSSSSFLYVPRDEECCHHEVSALYETLEWVRLHSMKVDSWEEMALAFLQQQIMTTIRQIRSERISSQTAIRILVGVASLLDLPLVRPMVQDTVIVEDVDSIDHYKLQEFLSHFGVVEWCSVSRLNPRFACCRFKEETSLVTLLEAVRTDHVPGHYSHTMSFRALSNVLMIPSATAQAFFKNDISEVMDTPFLMESVSYDKQAISSSTCASSPQSQCSIVDCSPFFVLG